MKIQISIEAETDEIRDLFFNQVLDSNISDTKTLTDSQIDAKIHNWEMLRRGRKLRRLYLDKIEPIASNLLTDQSEQR